MIDLLVFSTLKTSQLSSGLRAWSFSQIFALALLCSLSAQAQTQEQKLGDSDAQTTNSTVQTTESELTQSDVPTPSKIEASNGPNTESPALAQAVPALEKIINQPDAKLSAPNLDESKILDSQLSEEKQQERLENAKKIAALDIIELFDRANAVERELKQLRESLSIPPQIKQLNRELPEQLKLLNQEADEDLEAALHAYRWFITTDIRFRFAERTSMLQSQREPLMQFSQALSQVPKRTDQVLKEWGDAQKLLIQLDASNKAKERVASILRLAQVVSWESRKTETQLARSSYYFGQMEDIIQTVLDATNEDNSSLLTNFTHQGVTPFKALTIPPTWQEIAEVTRHTLSWNLKSLLLFTNTQLAKLVLHFLLFVFIAGSLMRTIRRRRYQQEHAQELEREADALRAPDEAPPLPKPESFYSLNHISLQHPIASAILITSVATIFIYEVLPTPAALLVLCAAIFSAAALHFRRDMSSSTILSLGAAALLLCLFLQVLSARLIAIDVWVMGIEGLLNLYLIYVLRKLDRFRDRGWWQTCFRATTFVWLVASIIGLLVWLAGFDYSSAILINGTCRQLLVTLAFIEAYSVLAGILRLSIDSQMLSRIRIIKNHGSLVLARTLLFFRVVLLIFWLQLASRAYTFSTALKNIWEELIARELSLGSLSFSLGSILALVIGTVVALYAARFIRFLLTEEALPRTQMRIGTRAAVTTGAYALSLGLGFITVLAAAGLQLDKLTILVSAFGVGIGFGLQNIVQNFVSGVILIFGRPINVGDRVQLGELFGTVTMIGFRASTVKTYQGAEVIVPNSSGHQLVFERR